MDLVTTVDTIHWVFAFLVLLAAVTVGWTQLGQRVMVALIGIQVLIGIVFATANGPALAGKGAAIGEHILGALLAMVAYIFARRLGQRGATRLTQIGLSALGLALLLGTAYLGLHAHRGFGL